MINNDQNTTVFFQSLGCPKNLVDTEVMLGITKESQMQVVTEPEKASVIVVNTCSFINDSKQESIDTILQMAQFKEAGTCKRLIVTGCLPQRYKADLKVSLPEVDAFVGTGQYQHILDYIHGKKEEDFQFKNPRYLHNEHTPRINSQLKHRAYLKISEGCVKNCSFCIIPKIRGTLRSRTMGSLFSEATRLVASGVKELSLIGQNLPDYGMDLRDGSSLAKLLRELATIEDLIWIRLHYVYPDELSDELLEVIATEPKICSYMDMPIQHINDRLLKLMNRKVTGSQIRERLRKLRHFLPDVSLRSTVIVGYPSETEAEFNELKDFVKEVGFDHLGVFAFSREENTDSYDHEGHLPEEIKQARRHELMRMQQKISRFLLEERVGQRLPVLVDGISEESEFLWQGRHEGQAAEVDGYVLLHSGDYRPGELVEVTIERAMEYDLIASPVAKTCALI